MSDQVQADATSFMHDIKERFANDEALYQDFLSVMMQLRQTGYGDGSIIQKINYIFAGNDDLRERFLQFLPPDVSMDQSQYASQGAINNQTPAETNDSKEADFAARYVANIRDRFSNDNDQTYSKFMEILQAYESQERSTREVLQEIVTLFQGHEDLISGFVHFLPPNYQIEANRIVEDIRRGSIASRPPMQQPQYSAPYLPPAVPVYETAAVPEHAAVARSKPRSRMASRTPASPPQQPMQMRTRRRVQEEEVEPESDVIPSSERKFFEKVRKEITSEELYHQFLQLLDLYNQNILPLSELFSSLTDLLHVRHPVLAQLRSYLSHKGISEDAMSHKQPYPTWEQIHSCVGPSPSYHKLPDNIPSRVGSQRSYADSQVLNDNYVSQAIGSEDNSFINMRRNTYEEALFRCEDDHFESDVILETTKSAIATLELLMKELNELEEESEDSYRLKSDSLSAIQLAAIRRVYAHNGMDKEVLKLLYINPKCCIPRILERLKEKQKEWLEEKANLDQRCREIQKQNYYLSLDHRSFYFRAQDKKNIASKALMDVIKEIAMKEDTEKKMIQYDTGAPHISFKFTDRSVHKQVIRLLLVAGKRLFNKSDMNRYKALLESLVIEFFHLTPNYITSAELENSGVQYTVGTAVSTPQGYGIISKYDSESKLYTVEINGAEVQLARRDILIQPTNDGDSEEEEEKEKEMEEEKEEMEEEEKEEVEEEMEEEEKPMPKTEVKTEPTSEEAKLDEVKVKEEDATAVKEEAAMEEEVPIQVETNEEPIPTTQDLIFGSNNLYVFYRLYQILYDRMQRAKELCSKEVYTEQNMTAHAVERALDENKEQESKSANNTERHIIIMDSLIQLLRGEMVNQTFEQKCREIVGTNGYFLYTIDKVVTGCAKMLQAVLNDRMTMQLMALRSYEKQQGGIRRELYRGNTLRIMGETRLGLFRMEYEEEGEAQEEEVVKGELRFWYVGCVHDLQHSTDNLTSDFFKYAENYLLQEDVEDDVDEKEMEKNEEKSSPFLTRARAKALSEMQAKGNMDEAVDEFVPDQEENEKDTKRSKAGRKRKHTSSDEEDSVESKKSR